MNDPRKKSETVVVVRERVWTDESMLESMQRIFSDYGFVSTARWHGIARSEGIPSVALYTIRFGSWNRAKELAGITPNWSRPKETYKKGFSDEEIIRAIADFLLDENPGHGRYGFAHYDRYRRANGGPSAALVRVRFKYWSAAKETAIRFNEERDEAQNRPS